MSAGPPPRDLRPCQRWQPRHRGRHIPGASAATCQGFNEVQVLRWTLEVSNNAENRASLAGSLHTHWFDPAQWLRLAPMSLLLRSTSSAAASTRINHPHSPSGTPGRRSPLSAWRRQRSRQAQVREVPRRQWMWRRQLLGPCRPRRLTSPLPSAVLCYSPSNRCGIAAAAASCKGTDASDHCGARSSARSCSEVADVCF